MVMIRIIGIVMVCVSVAMIRRGGYGLAGDVRGIWWWEGGKVFVGSYW